MGGELLFINCSILTSTCSLNDSVTILTMIVSHFAFTFNSYITHIHIGRGIYLIHMITIKK
jgi:hypothetical protein